MDINLDLIKYYDDSALGLEPGTYDKVDFEGNDELTRMYKFIGDNALNVLDYGCGFGFGLMTAKVLGSKIKTGLGIDTSSNMISYASNTCLNSNIHDIQFKVGNEDSLLEIEDNYFDGVICSSILDVVPKEIAKNIINQLSRVIKKDGYLFVKLNYFIDDRAYRKLASRGATQEGNYVFINGVLRWNNLETSRWIKMLKEFELIEQSEFPQSPGNPCDRILLFKRK